jgi:ATP-dependent DNA helicase
MDLQAQDRTHQIGQTRPMLTFRLVSRHTIKSKIVQRASKKRQLEALVIAKGRYEFNLTLIASDSHCPLASSLPSAHACLKPLSPLPGKFKGPIGGSAKPSEA